MQAGEDAGVNTGRSNHLSKPCPVLTD
jgi:hypothetical protein